MRGSDVSRKGQARAKGGAARKSWCVQSGQGPPLTIKTKRRWKAGALYMDDDHADQLPNDRAFWAQLKKQHPEGAPQYEAPDVD